VGIGFGNRDNRPQALFRVGRLVLTFAIGGQIEFGMEGFRMGWAQGAMGQGHDLLENRRGFRVL
jgi:hypothetical protein